MPAPAGRRSCNAETRSTAPMNPRRPGGLRCARHSPTDPNEPGHAEGGTERVGGPGRDRPAVPALLDGLNGPLSRGALADRGSRAFELGASVDHRRLRFLPRWIPDHDGYSRRSDRQTPPLADRRGRVRRRVRGRRLLYERRDVDCVARIPRRRGRDSGALDPLPDPEHVPRPRAAHLCDRHLGDEFLGRCCTVRCWVASCSSSSGGGPCSSCQFR